MKRYLPITAVTLFFLLSALALIIIYDKGKEQPPLAKAQIPQETIDFFNNLLGWGDIGGIFHPDSIRDWKRYEDIDSMCRLEDSLFIIFYSTKDSVNESIKAQIALRYAHDAVKPLDDFMGSYPFPYTLNGRKLPIYLANTTKDYSNICKQLGHGEAPSYSIGLYCWRYSTTGTITDGIIISPQCWKTGDKKLNTNSDDDGLLKTLWHEMNHFAFFTNLDLVHNPVPPLWVSEGCAEYFADNRARVAYLSPAKLRDCHLDAISDIRYTGGYDPYVVGLSAFYAFDQYHSRATLSRMVTSCYKMSFSQAVDNTLGSNQGLKKWDDEWHNWISKK